MSGRFRAAPVLPERSPARQSELTVDELSALIIARMAASRSEMKMRATWVPRVGTQATQVLVSRGRLDRILIAAVTVWSVAMAVCETIGTFEVLLVGWLLLIAFGVPYVMSVRMTFEARRLAASHLGVSSAESQFMPTYAPAKFDRWIARRGSAGRARSWKRP